MNYSTNRKDAARLLKKCATLGLPAWAQAHVEHEMRYAAHWWQISRDKSKDKALRAHGYEKAVRVLSFVIDMLGAYWRSVRPAPSGRGLFAVMKYGEAGL